MHVDMITEQKLKELSDSNDMVLQMIQTKVSDMNGFNHQLSPLISPSPEPTTEQRALSKLSALSKGTLLKVKDMTLKKDHFLTGEDFTSPADNKMEFQDIKVKTFLNEKGRTSRNMVQKSSN